MAKQVGEGEKTQPQEVGSQTEEEKNLWEEKEEKKKMKLKKKKKKLMKKIVGSVFAGIAVVGVAAVG